MASRSTSTGGRSGRAQEQLVAGRGDAPVDHAVGQAPSAVGTAGEVRIGVGGPVGGEQGSGDVGEGQLAGRQVVEAPQEEAAEEQGPADGQRLLGGGLGRGPLVPVVGGIAVEDVHEGLVERARQHDAEGVRIGGVGLGEGPALVQVPQGAGPLLLEAGAAEVLGDGVEGGRLVDPPARLRQHPGPQRSAADRHQHGDQVGDGLVDGVGLRGDGVVERGDDAVEDGVGALVGDDVPAERGVDPALPRREGEELETAGRPLVEGIRPLAGPRHDEQLGAVESPRDPPSEPVGLLHHGDGVHHGAEGVHRQRGGVVLPQPGDAVGAVGRRLRVGQEAEPGPVGGDRPRGRNRPPRPDGTPGRPRSSCRPAACRTPAAPSPWRR